MMDFALAYRNAVLNANAAIANAPHEFCCGFAWAVIKPARGSFVSWLKKNNIGRSGTYGGWQLYAQVPTQSMNIKELWMRTFADSLREELGIKINVYSRMD